MDKKEYQEKLDDINRAVAVEDYTTAAAIADAIDWKRVRNVQTLLMVSEIYEAEKRYEDSKNLLMRAYRRSPLGRTVLYRLVECTIALKEFDEAIEYYSEYCQAAPKDNNRYILKYKIYRGRGSSVEEQIDILKQYLEQEKDSEKWSYELAKLYKEAGRAQECINTCDDLVLWYQSGKYVIKALELKRKLAPLTPRQQEIYDHRFDDEENRAVKEEGTLPDAGADETARSQKESMESQEEAIRSELAEDISRAAAEVREKAVSLTEEKPEPEVEDEAVPLSSEEKDEESRAAAPEREKSPEAPLPAAEAAPVKPQFGAGLSYNEKSLQEDLVRSMREIVDGVGARNEVDEEESALDRVIDESKEDQEAAVAVRGARMTMEGSGAEVKESVRTEPDIDDILLSMNEQIERARQTSGPSGVLSASEEAAMNDQATGKASAMYAAGPELTEEHPVRLRKGEAENGAPQDEGEIKEIQETKSDLPLAEPLPAAEKAPGLQEEMRGAQMEERSSAPMEDGADARSSREEDAAAPVTTKSVSALKSLVRDSGEQIQAQSMKAQQSLADAIRKAQDDVYSAVPERAAASFTERASVFGAPKVEYTEEIAKARTRVLPTGEIARLHQQFMAGEDAAKDAGTPSASPAPSASGTDAAPQAEPSTILLTASESVKAPFQEEARPFAPQGEPETQGIQTFFGQSQVRTPEPGQDMHEGMTREAASGNNASGPRYDGRSALLKDYHRDLFRGFLGIGNLEEQIAGAIIQAESKQDDRSSRTGNVLILGAHGCGKTTIATGIAKAIAEDKGTHSVKMARIYAADLNRKDIAATIAKIAGGVLIIEEAGDLEDSIVDQITTAMEFRTDGMIVILEDEQRYVHDLLMRHPRFTMKFTSQIYIPPFTTNDLLNFGQIYARSKDYVLSDKAADALSARIDAVAQTGEAVSITNVCELVDRAIHNAGKFFRRMGSAKKRYDAQDRIILREKDFR